jgi:hypothetical protein
MVNTTKADLVEACAFWQAGRDGGSSLLRAGARVITAIPHYFCAGFINALEDEARQDPQALTYACVLLFELATSTQKDPSQWAEQCQVIDQSFAGRGLKANGENDKQIERRLDDGVIEMPLWGLSLDRKVTEHYGTRFLLEIVDSFPAIPAFMHSDTKAQEQELITGGTYEVLSLDRGEGSTHARLRWTGPCRPRVLCNEIKHPETS